MAASDRTESREETGEYATVHAEAVFAVEECPDGEKEPRFETGPYEGQCWSDIAEQMPEYYFETWGKLNPGWEEKRFVAWVNQFYIVQGTLIRKSATIPRMGPSPGPGTWLVGAQKAEVTPERHPEAAQRTSHPMETRPMPPRRPAECPGCRGEPDPDAESGWCVECRMGRGAARREFMQARSAFERLAEEFPMSADELVDLINVDPRIEVIDIQDPGEAEAGGETDQQRDFDPPHPPPSQLMPPPPFVRRPLAGRECMYCGNGFLQGFAEQHWEDHLRQRADRGAGPLPNDLPDPTAEAMQESTTTERGAPGKTRPTGRGGPICEMPLEELGFNPGSPIPTLPQTVARIRELWPLWYTVYGSLCKLAPPPGCRYPWVVVSWRR